MGSGRIVGYPEVSFCNFRIAGYSPATLYRAGLMMEVSERVVTRIPMSELWQEDGTPVTERVASLTSTEIAELLRSGPVRFVIADVGTPLQWVPSRTCFDFWTVMVKNNVANPEETIPLAAYPQSFFFAASLWKDNSEPAAAQPIILLEKHY